MAGQRQLRSPQLPSPLDSVAWASTPLGLPSEWPESLLTAVRTLLPSRLPIMICWGDDLVQIYNEAFAPLLGDKHPAALGQCVADCWANEWPRIKPIIDELLAGEELLSDQALPLFLNRDGYVEETYWNIYPNLILGADNRRQGLVLSAMDDTTGWCRTVG